MPYDSGETQGSGQQTFHSETETDLCSWNDWPEEDTTDITEYFLLYIKRRGDNFKRHIFKEGFDYMHSLKIERRSWMDGRQQQAGNVWAIKNLDSGKFMFLGRRSRVFFFFFSYFFCGRTVDVSSEGRRSERGAMESDPW